MQSRFGTLDKAVKLNTPAELQHQLKNIARRATKSTWKKSSRKRKHSLDQEGNSKNRIKWQAKKLGNEMQKFLQKDRVAEIVGLFQIWKRMWAKGNCLQTVIKLNGSFLTKTMWCSCCQSLLDNCHTIIKWDLRLLSWHRLH